MERSAAEALNQLHQEDPWFNYPDAVELLSGLAPDELPALVAALGDPSRKIRAAVARALGAYAGPAAAAGIAQALADPAPDVRRAAIGALADRPGAETVARLGRILRDDPDLYTRLAAVQGLAGSADSAAGPVLADLLTTAGDADPLLLSTAAEALARFGPAVARAPLVALLAHPAAAAREAAVNALAALTDPAAAAPLRAYAAREADAYLAATARAVADRLARDY